ncbi:DUF2950 family protein [Dankookia rubra]|uniref:DUF2950 family protein n=1 Tax=Dankookia rubra TaxID=1442381 RepID=A0A4V3A9K4_9PROT|nr:DUF2950 family protein [Dankookia rubra]
MLGRQRASAPGGAIGYVANGPMTGGLAIVASPARYGSSGTKTLMVSHHDTVWERDLGASTARKAAAIASFDPGPGWARIAEQELARIAASSSSATPPGGVPRNSRRHSRPAFGGRLGRMHR